MAQVTYIARKDEDADFANLTASGTLAVTGAITQTGASQFNSTVTVGVDDTGHDVQLFGATAGAHLLWDESADTLRLVGGASTVMLGTLIVGVDDVGHDVQLFGATAGAHLLWDESADTLRLVGGAATVMLGTLTVGVDDAGHDVQLFGATAGAHLLWDESADTLRLVGGASTVMLGPLTVGVDDAGHDVQFFGATANANMLWDESADELIFATGASIDLTADAAMIDFQDGGASSIDPSATAETGWINVNIAGTIRYIPYYAVS